MAFRISKFIVLTLLIFYPLAAVSQQTRPPSISVQPQLADPQRVIEYWTGERMKDAQPAPLIQPLEPLQRPPIAEKPSEEPRILMQPRFMNRVDEPKPGILARNAQPVPYPSVGLPSPNGKLFFSQAGKDYVCSASAVSVDLILTAAHCAYGSGKYSENILFILQFSPTDLSKKFVITQSIVPGDWIVSSYRYSDQAIMRVQGTFPASYGIVAYPSASWALPGIEFGYPAEPPFPGNQMYFVSPVEPSDADPADKLTISIFTDMNGGSSGGPWVGHDKQGNPWYVFGLNSYKLVGDVSKMYSPYFAFIMEALVKCATQNVCN
jgi:Trypsin